MGTVLARVTLALNFILVLLITTATLSRLLLPASPQLLFLSTPTLPNRSDTWTIMLLDVDRAISQQLTTGSAALWSPDGSRVAITRRTSQTNSPAPTYGASIIDTTGQVLNQIPSVDACGLSWSPDGQHVTFTDNGRPYIAELDGSVLNSNPVQPLFADDHSSSIVCPRWSPSGQWITYTTLSGQYLYEISSKRVYTVTTSQYEDSFAWLPDGHHIVFRSHFSGSPTWEVNVMDVDRYTSGAANPIQWVLTDADYATDFAWSPDSSRIALSTITGLAYEIMVMDGDGKNQRQITHTNTLNVAPAWSPDGQTIAYSSYQNGYYQIYLMDADGSNVRQLTGTSVQNILPQWRPR